MEGDTTPAAGLLPIPSPYLSSYAPGPVNFTQFSFTGGQLTIAWSGTGTLLQSSNPALPLAQWTTAATVSPFQVTPVAGAPHMFYRLKQ
jgi:hypothetical protein